MERAISSEDVEKLRRRLSAEAGGGRMLSTAELRRLAPSQAGGLRRKPVRSASGVVPVAVMASPSPCPHGRCVPCPGGPGAPYDSPQSYTGFEPAAARAREHGYRPGAQVAARLEQLSACGHATGKVELIVMGGTFPARDPDYQRWFVGECYGALNRSVAVQWKAGQTHADATLDADHGQTVAKLQLAKEENERAPARCVALTLETRPDRCASQEIDAMLELGATKVELGVQSLDDSVLLGIRRGHDVAEVADATARLRDAGLKVGYHLMPGLPGLTREEDLRAMLRVVEDPDFRPDLLKLYPTLVMPGTELHKSWLRGEYVPLDEAAAVALLADFKSRLPRWVRVSRVERDIPAGLIAAGVRASNIRQLVQGRLRERGLRCACIRCREVGRLGTERPGRGTASPDPRGLVVREERYGASGGEELFLSLELPEGDALVAYARVRRPSPRAWRPEIAGAAVLREVRVLGEVLPLHARPRDGAGSLEWQHRGLGARLVGLSEEAARAWGMDRLAVMAGMGTRGYFGRLGYSLEGPYMVSPRL